MSWSAMVSFMKIQLVIFWHGCLSVDTCHWCEKELEGFFRGTDSRPCDTLR